jgi:hypothetical protein
VNAYLAVLLDGDVHSRLEWELAVFTACSLLGVGFISWLGRDFVGRYRRLRRIVRHTALQVAQHRDELVANVRGGTPFPPLPDDPDDGNGDS